MESKSFESLPVLLSGKFTSKIQLHHSLELEQARDMIADGMERGDQVQSLKTDCMDWSALLEKFNQRFIKRVTTKLKRSPAYLLWQDQERKKRSFDQVSLSQGSAF